MRELMRPALLMAAQTGCFLAIVAWIAGQSWQVVGFGYGMMGAIDHSGIAVAFGAPLPNTAGVKVEVHRPLRQDTLDGGSGQSAGYGVAPRVITLLSGPGGAIVGIRHWLVVTLFAGVYGLLKWVDRSQEIESPQ